MVCCLPLFATIPTGYYNAANGKKGEALRSQLHSIISANYQEVSYGGLEPYYAQTDLDPEGHIYDIYSTCTFTMNDANCSQSTFCQCWNKEHTVPQSWFGESSPMKSDLFHVLPTDARVNNLRGNMPYGENGVTANVGNNPNTRGHIGTSNFGSYSVGTVFEPVDEFKGDLARIYLYMATRYMDRQFTKSSEGQKVFTYTSGTTGLTPYAVALFLKWHREDPVSQREIDRNDAVYGIQHNRNPFVDYPYLAEYIWGDQTTASVDLANDLIASDDPRFVPGMSDGNSDSSPITIVYHPVSWVVNGEEYSAGEPTNSVREGLTVTHLPIAPASCSEESEQFVGWSSELISGTTDELPTDLFSDATDAPQITEPTTYYAVFAHLAIIESEAVAVTDSVVFADMFSSDTQVSASIAVGANLLTFIDGTNPTKYFNNGNAIRLYAGGKLTVTGTNISKIVFTFGTGDHSNAITVSTGSFNTDTWTGNANSVEFTVGGTSKHRRIAGIKIESEGAGDEYVYSRYMTTCTEQSTAVPEAKEEKTMENKATKRIVNGQLMIIVGQRQYNVLGISCE